jgi:hypothetical protein
MLAGGRFSRVVLAPDCALADGGTGLTPGTWPDDHRSVVVLFIFLFDHTG